MTTEIIIVLWHIYGCLRAKPRISIHPGTALVRNPWFICYHPTHFCLFQTFLMQNFFFLTQLSHFFMVLDCFTSTCMKNQHPICLTVKFSQVLFGAKDLLKRNLALEKSTWHLAEWKVHFYLSNVTFVILSSDHFDRFHLKKKKFRLRQKYLDFCFSKLKLHKLEQTGKSVSEKIGMLSKQGWCLTRRFWTNLVYRIKILTSSICVKCWQSV